MPNTHLASHCYSHAGTYQGDLHALPGAGILCGVLELANLGGSQHPAARRQAGVGDAFGKGRNKVYYGSRKRPS